MSLPLLTTATTMTCAHGGTVSGVPSATNAVAGAVLLCVGDTFTVTGCTFTVANAPSPCISVQWSGPATSVQCAGVAVLTEASTGLCLSAAQAPQGQVQIAASQTQVSGQ